MRNALRKHQLGPLIVWLAICPLAWASSGEPVLHPANAIQADDVNPNIEMRLTGMEQRLFSDATDGRLDDFPLFSAALIACGVDNQSVIDVYRGRLQHWADELRQNGSQNLSPRQRAEMIF